MCTIHIGNITIKSTKAWSSEQINTYTTTLDPTKFAPDPATLNVSQWAARCYLTAHLTARQQKAWHVYVTCHFVFFVVCSWTNRRMHNPSTEWHRRR